MQEQVPVQLSRATSQLVTPHRKWAELLRSTDYKSFEDFPSGGKIIGGGFNLLRRHGLARGKVFRDWFSGVMEGRTFASVKDDEGNYRLRLIAVDVTNRDLLVLPEDLAKYRLPGQGAPIEPDDFEIADAARMSMSIPYFFEPIELICERNSCPSLIVDGGTLSNFPVWLFDVDPRQAGRPPKRATFGFTLVGGRWVGSGLRKLIQFAPWPVRFGADIFQTAQEAWEMQIAAMAAHHRKFPHERLVHRVERFDASSYSDSALVGRK